jgi:hypothetical protein
MYRFGMFGHAVIIGDGKGAAKSMLFDIMV